jgi:acetylornithine deacetylase/succinyl-diaminopimelate desuccinylase-like protein
MIGPVRRESSTVVILAGAVTEPLLAGLARSSNVSLVRPPDEEKDSRSAAALALDQAARRASPYVLVPADPLAEAATAQPPA